MQETQVCSVILEDPTCLGAARLCVHCAQSCPTLCDPMDCSSPGSSVHGIFQVKTLEWVAISSSDGSSWARDWTHVSCIGRLILYHWATREACMLTLYLKKKIVFIYYGFPYIDLKKYLFYFWLCWVLLCTGFLWFWRQVRGLLSSCGAVTSLVVEHGL